jgi:opacity protein-like surface antigen
MQRGERKFGLKASRAGGLMAVGALLLSPIIVPAVAAQIYSKNSIVNLNDWSSQFTAAGVDKRLAEKVKRNAVRTTAFPFTPAGLDNRSRGTLTVAARADVGNAITMRNTLQQIEAGSGTTLRLNNSSYQLTAARGWQAFALPVTVAEQPRLDTMLGKGNFRLDDGAQKKPSRFNTDVKFDAARGVAPSPRGNAAAGDYSVNVGGSVRVAKGVDITAGVRYSRDVDRVDLATTDQADNEAVYVGTKIKF